MEICHFLSIPIFSCPPWPRGYLMAHLRFPGTFVLCQFPLAVIPCRWGDFLSLIQRKNDHGATVLLYEKETRICHNWDLGDYFLRPLWGNKKPRQFFALWKGFGWFQEPLTINRNSGQVSLKSVWGPWKPSIIFFSARSESNYLCLSWTHFCVFFGRWIQSKE